MFALDNVVSMDIWGVEKDGTNADHPTYAAWTVNTKRLPPVLVVTRMSATEKDFPKLIRKIQEVAARSAIRKMEAWNIPGRLLRGVEETGGKTFEWHRRSPAIKWYGKGETADIEWIFNEKYAYPFFRAQWVVHPQVLLELVVIFTISTPGHNQTRRAMM